MENMQNNMQNQNTLQQVKPLNKNLAMICGTIIIACLIIAGTLLYTNSKSNSNVVVNGNVANQQPQPQQPTGPQKVSVDDDPVLGKADAAITMIEFSDFQCPFCRKFMKEALPQIMKEYVNTGKVKFVYRDYPLPFHEGAIPAAQGAECAREQGKFLEMHDAIFNEQDKLDPSGTVQFTSDDVKKWAAKIGLNTATFNQCLDSGKYKAEVDKDTADGKAAGVNGTPAFFIGRSTQSGTIDGTLVSGAQPFAAFKTIIDQMLTQ